MYHLAWKAKSCSTSKMYIIWTNHIRFTLFFVSCLLFCFQGLGSLLDQGDSVEVIPPESVLLYTEHKSFDLELLLSQISQ